jgi:hypothetical protein
MTSDGLEALKAFPQGRTSRTPEGLPKNRREFEELLRSLGYPRQAAKAIASRGFVYEK